MKWYRKLTAASPQPAAAITALSKNVSCLEKKDEYNDLMLEIRSFSSFLFPFDLFKASGFFEIAKILNSSKEDKSMWLLM